MASLQKRAYRAASELLDLPARNMWPYALPGAAAVYERRWQRRIDRAPLMTPEQHAERVGLKDIEELIGCSMCGERRMQPILHHTHPKYPGYHVVRCPSCTFLYRHPGIRPERLGELYANSYSKFLTGGYEKKRRRRYRLVMDAFAPLFTAGEGRRLFDFGCGTGLFLDEAYARGFDTYGVDLSPDSIEQARTRPSGANTYFGAPLDVPEIASGGFDVITLWSVLAHLTTPVEDLAMLRGLLKPDGVLLILTVNANSIELKAHGPAWNGFTKNHLKFFSPTTLPMLLEQAGYAAVTFKPMYGDTVEAGTTRLSERNQRRLRRVVEQGNQGNMLRAVTYLDEAVPGRWGLPSQRLGTRAPMQPAPAAS